MLRSGRNRRSVFSFLIFFLFAFRICVFTVTEVAERMAFLAIALNITSYLVLEMRQSLPTAASHVNNWMGAAYGLTLLGAYLADAYLGRYRNIVVFALIYVVVSTLSFRIVVFHGIIEGRR